MEAQELSSKPAITCSPDATLAEAARLMRDNNVGSVVVTDHGSLIGMLTDRDIAIRALIREATADEPVRSFMTPDVAAVYEEDDVFTAATMMAARGCRRLPVLDPRGHVTGVLALDDLVDLFTDQLEKLTYLIRRETHL